jgi:hypothetical protein
MLTYVRLAVVNGGAFNQAIAFANTWAQFSTGSGPANVKTWDGRTMAYYTEGFGICATTAERVVQNLGYSGNVTVSAQCGAFALLLQSALAMNGIHSNFINVFATDFTTSAAWNGVDMVIKNWQTIAQSQPPNQSPWLYNLRLNPGMLVDLMVPAPPTYGDLVNGPGLYGQGPQPAQTPSTHTPVEKVFERHFIVQVAWGNPGCTDYGTLSTSQLYDPSYGVTYGPAGVSNTTQEGFELRAVYGFAARIPLYGDTEWGADWHFRLPIPGQPDISFQCLAAF